MIVIEEEQYFDNVTRVTVVSDKGVEFERYNLFENGVEIHLQDDRRTLKIFPAPSAKPPLPKENEGEAEDTSSPSFPV